MITDDEIKIFLTTPTVSIATCLEMSQALDRGDFNDRPELQRQLQEKLAAELKLRDTAQEILRDRAEWEEACRFLGQGDVRSKKGLF